MNFLAPAFFAGLAAIAVPVIIHLIHRERKVVVEFPSLMFLQRIPYRSVRRQKLRHILLLVLRCIALALLVAAFARPFFERQRPTISTTGAREVVVLLDRSASMGYADHWDKARAAARKVVSGLTGSDRATLVLFASDASVASEPMATPDRLNAAINAASLTAEATRFAPALKLASQLVSSSQLPRREVVLISDFQKVGWASRNEILFPKGTTITPIDLGGAEPDVAVTQVTTDRDSSGDRDHVTVAARVINTSSVPRTVTATLTLGGRQVDTRRVTVGASAAAQAAFGSIAVPSGATRATIGITPDSLKVDDVLNFTIAPDEAVPVLVVEPANAREDQSLYISRALAIGDRPTFTVDVKRVNALTPRDIADRALVILDEVAPPGGEVGARLRAFVDAGGGLVIVPGENRAETWPAQWRAILPATIGQIVDRSGDAGGTLSSVDYSHPIFELFNAPRSGDFSTARFFRYRALTPQPGASIPAKFDDGSPALAERTVGAGKVVVWAASLDKNWTNLPLQPVFLPFVHQLGKHVGRYADPRASYAAGEVLDLSRHGELTAPFIAGRASDTTTQLVLQAPSGARERVTATGPNHLITLREQGFYELRGRDTPVGSGRPIAVNVDPTESDLSHLDPQDVVLAVTAPTGEHQLSSDVSTATPQDQERRQHVWWYLLLLALFLMAVETAFSNRLSRATS
ncbi:MAG TPA: BatA domain-containing protein [Gemmatimonadaceae bacterium]|nr:BatA domain-containing protein [Gemmatimonadaceae bacterium]